MSVSTERAVVLSRIKLPWLSLCALLAALLVALPMGVVMLNLLVPRGDTWKHLASTVLPEYLWNTLLLASGVGMGVALVGVGCAWLTSVCRFPGRRFFEWALILPIATPAYVMAYVYTDFLQFAGPLQGALRAWTGWRAEDYFLPDIRSLGGAVFVLIAVLYPYVYLLARTAFLEQSGSSFETARVLGYGSWSTFFRVALPLARPAIVAGVALAMMETLADYGTVAYFGVDTFSTGVFRAWFSLGDPVAAAQLGALLLIGVGAVLSLERALRGRSAFHAGPRREPTPSVLRGARAVMAFLACAVPLSAGFLLPLVLLVRLATHDAEPGFGERFAGLAANSVTLAALCALLAVLCALLIAYAARLRPGPMAAFAGRTAGLGYALPGVVIAVGVLVPVTLVDQWFSVWMSGHFGIAPKLWLTGTIIALVYACVVRFMSIALQTVEAGLARIRRSMDEAARSLGLGPAQALARVHAPLLARSLVTAALLVFVDVMKELPATLAIRPFNFDTLAVQTYNLAKDERLAEASVAALAIVGVGLIPVLLLARAMARR
ncbi:MAG: iron ABC transporter permease [Betaproteobacteria bacterium]|nr:iron ABC transporter permease [Betaproteobacteria bacterium]